jgi:hypothetical protein
VEWLGARKQAVSRHANKAKNTFFMVALGEAKYSFYSFFRKTSTLKYLRGPVGGVTRFSAAKGYDVGFLA